MLTRYYHSGLALNLEEEALSLGDPKQRTHYCSLCLAAKPRSSSSTDYQVVHKPAAQSPAGMYNILPQSQVSGYLST
jgi:hypothetical protein